MGREANPAERQTGPPADLDDDQRQRDRDPEPPVEHLVQVAVAWVVVVGGIAAEALLAEQQRIQLGQLSFGRRLAPEALAQRLAQPIELIQVLAQVEVRVLLDRDQQRGARDVNLALVAADEGRQGPSRFDRLRQRAQVPDVGLSDEPDEVLLLVGVAVPVPAVVLALVPPPYVVVPVVPLLYELPLLKPPYVVSWSLPRPRRSRPNDCQAQ
jgi:hypothetical protein